MVQHCMKLIVVSSHSISTNKINKLSILEVVELRAKDGGRTTVSEWDTGNQSIGQQLMK